MVDLSYTDPGRGVAAACIASGGLDANSTAADKRARRLAAFAVVPRTRWNAVVRRRLDRTFAGPKQFSPPASYPSAIGGISALRTRIPGPLRLSGLVNGRARPFVRFNPDARP